MLADTAGDIIDAIGDGDVTLTPPSGQGAARTCLAIIRRQPATDPMPGQPPRPSIEVELKNSGTAGITPAEAAAWAGMATITLAYQRGGSTTTYAINIPADGREWHDAGMVRLWLL